MLMIPDSSAEVSAQWLTGVLQGAEVIRGRVSQVEVTPFGDGIGLLSSMLRCRLQYADSEEAAPATVVVKLEPNLQLAREASEEAHAFEREVRFYREIAPHAPLNVPKFYHGATDAHRGVLVLEDMSHLETRNQVHGLHDCETIAAVKQLARLHSHYWNHPDLESLTWMPAHDKRLTENFTAFWDQFEEVYGLRIGPEAVALGRRLVSRIDWLREEIRKPPSTICHGDFRADNLLFDPDAGSDADNPKVMIIDWQLATRSFAALDVSRLIGGSEPSLERRGHPQEVLTAWHETLLGEGVSDYSIASARRDFQLGALTHLCFPVRIFSHWGPDPGGRRGQLMDSMVTRVYAQALEVDAAERLG